jgi:hypothetical protein
VSDPRNINLLLSEDARRKDRWRHEIVDSQDMDVDRMDEFSFRHGLLPARFTLQETSREGKGREEKNAKDTVGGDGVLGD